MLGCGTCGSTSIPRWFWCKLKLGNKCLEKWIWWLYIACFERKREYCSNNADVIQWEHRWWQWEWRGTAGGITLPELVPFDGEAGEVHLYNRQGLKTIGCICSVRPNILKSWVIHKNKGLRFAGKNQIWLQQPTSAKEISYSVLLSMGCVLSSLPQFPFLAWGLESHEKYRFQKRELIWRQHDRFGF